MRLDIDVARAITEEEASLINRARQALLYIDRRFTNEVAVAVVFPREAQHLMRLDFKAVPSTGGIGQAYLGPQVPLTAALFDGNNFTAAFRRKMDDSFDAFDAWK